MERNATDNGPIKIDITYNEEFFSPEAKDLLEKVCFFSGSRFLSLSLSIDDFGCVVTYC